MNEQTSQAETKAVGAESRYLCFSLGSEEYAVPLLTVREVIAMPDVTPLPFAPAYFLGIMNLRGQVISVMDLRQKFGMKPQAGTETAVIICDIAGLSIGVVVDSINSVLAATANQIAGKPEATNSKAADFITGVFRREKHLILFIDIARTLNLEDHAAVNGAGKKAA